jgi:hypothetical protein
MPFDVAGRNMSRIGITGNRLNLDADTLCWGVAGILFGRVGDESATPFFTAANTLGLSFWSGFGLYLPSSDVPANQKYASYVICQTGHARLGHSNCTCAGTICSSGKQIALKKDLRPTFDGAQWKLNLEICGQRGPSP